MSKIRVLLTDDHTLFRNGIRTLLSREADIEVVGEAENGSQSVEKVAALNADVVLLDIGMSGLSSFEAARQIKKIRPRTKILFLTMYDDEDYLVECMEVGGHGYVLKDSPAPQLLAAIRDVYRGGSYLSPKMLSQLVADFRSSTKTTHRKPRFATLTPREKEILKFLAEGQSVKEIATHLNLSVKTIEAHKFNLMRKLDIHNKAQLVQYAIQKKIIKIPVGP
jgi:DNA-binding NarL/FixJ family response regulator